MQSHNVYLPSRNWWLSDLCLLAQTLTLKCTQHFTSISSKHLKFGMPQIVLWCFATTMPKKKGKNKKFKTWPKLAIFSISVNDSSILPRVQDKILGVILPCVFTVKITYKEPDHVSSPQLLEQWNKSIITTAWWPVPLLPLCPFRSNHNTAVTVTLYKYKLD